MNFAPEMLIFNLTGHERHIVEKMKMYSQLEWFKNQDGSFGKSYSVPFAEILTTRCFGFTFNILAFEDLFNTHEYEKKFASIVHVVKLGLKQRSISLCW